MSHIHIPDGVLPWWLWLSGWVAAAVLLTIAANRATRSGARRAVPLIGAVSALVLVSMSSEIVPIAYHVNLTVIAGVLLMQGGQLDFDLGIACPEDNDLRPLFNERVKNFGLSSAAERASWGSEGSAPLRGSRPS